MEIIFPQYIGQRYWNIHYLYVLNIFKYLNWNITFEEREDFRVTINGKDFLFDYFDNCDAIPKVDIPVFKFHCKEETSQIYSFPPVSFYNWDEYCQLEKEIKYEPKNGKIISNRQRPYANALERRTNIQNLLKNNLDNVETKIILQSDYWKEINNIKYAIFVPGYSNNILDRGQFQYMAFGCCTISPKLPEILPFDNKLIDCHNYYIFINDDYSNLLNIISKLERYYIMSYPTMMDIGYEAKELFKRTSIPEVIGKWIESKL